MYTITIDSYIGDGAYSAAWLRNQLRLAGDDDVQLRIASYGGDTNQALQMYELLREHGKAEAVVYGHSASAATIIAMGCSKVSICKTAMFLIHKCWGLVDIFTGANSDDLDKIIADLEASKKTQEKIDLVVAGIYSDRIGKPVNEILDLLSREEWLTVDEALEWGLVDEIIDGLPKIDPDKQLQARLCAWGLPELPASALPQRERSALAKVIAAIKDAVTPTPAPEQKLEEVEAPNLAEAIGAAILSDMDGVLSGLRKEDAEKVENLINTLKAERDALEKKVETLLQLPGDDTDDVMDEAGDDHLSSKSQNAYNKFKHLI